MTSLAEWRTEACDVAKAFRLGACMQAGDPMADLVRRVASEYGASSPEMKNELSLILTALLDCHKNNDWLGVADYLEFELVDWLRRVIPEIGA